MGDRALIQFKGKDASEHSPVIYTHWAGYRVRERLTELRELMRGRDGDVSYTAARFVGLCHNASEGNLSLGIWNHEGLLDEDDSHGDAGCFVCEWVDGCLMVETFGGYGFGKEERWEDPLPRAEDGRAVFA